MSVWDSLDKVNVSYDDNLRTAFKNSIAAGLTELARRVSAPFPTLSFPTLSGSAPLPLPNVVSVAPKDILFPVCWGAGLSPRPCNLDSAGNTALLGFVSDPLHPWSIGPAPLERLKLAADLKPSSDIHFSHRKQEHMNVASWENVTEDTGQSNLFVESILPVLEKVFGVVIQVHPFSLRQWVSLRLPVKVCFTQVMNAISMSLSANWTWSGEVVLLGPPANCAQANFNQDPCTVVKSSDQSMNKLLG